MKLATERAVREALIGRFESPAYAVLPGVADGTGRNKNRTIDAIIASLWPSRGLWIAGVEIKVSRGDLVRELADPAKQESVFKYCDYFWLAVGDESIVRDGDLPETWGLLVPGRGGKKLAVAKAAPRLEPQPMPRSFLVAILRRADEQISTLRQTLHDELRKDVRAEVAEELERLRTGAAEHRRLAAGMRHAELVDRFAERAGISFASWNKEAVDEAADLVRVLGIGRLSGLLKSTRQTAEGTRRVVERMLRTTDELLAGIDLLEAEAKAAPPSPEPAPANGAEPNGAEPKDGEPTCSTST